MQDFTKGLNESTKKMLSSALPLVIVVILAILVGNFGFSKVQDLRGQIDQAKKDETTLKQKLNILQTLSSSATTGASVTAAALPEKNPSLIAISQIKFVAASNGVVVSGVKSSSGFQIKGLSESNTTFTAEGARTQVFNFLEGLFNIAPITLVTQAKITETAGLVRAEVAVTSFSAPYPKTISNVTQQISDLSQSDKQVLTKIMSFTQPTFIEAAPTQEGINPAPFGEAIVTPR